MIPFFLRRGVFSSQSKHFSAISFLIASTAFGQASSISLEDSDAYVAWREGVRGFSSLRLTYAYERGPTDRFLAMTEGREFEGDGLMLMRSMGTRREGVLRVSRSGAGLKREWMLERFEENVGEWRFEPGAADRYPNERDDSSSHVEIHGDGIYFHHFPHKNRGAIWPKWDDRTHYPLVYVMPPDPGVFELSNVDETGLVLDFDNGDTLLRRYHLDPEQGMMPTRIEYYQVLRDGGLFLFRYFTVEEYAETNRGTFLPLTSTVHDLARQHDDGRITNDVDVAYTMTAYEEDVEFDADEFEYAFPDGTFVRDNIAGMQYRVGEELSGALDGLDSSIGEAAPDGNGVMAAARDSDGNALASDAPNAIRGRIVVLWSALCLGACVVALISYWFLRRN